ncbi:2-oxoacid dehydrogenase acyltransferase [Gracilaria domingensis]|nr:2-oxoacid dehydrogenase acyltransferase [Gracilaria domingensis]
MTAGRLVAWKKREGDAFLEGDDIADVESDKATMPISAREDGFMARIFVPDDTPDIPLGQLLAITVEEPEHVAAFADYQPPSTDPDPPSPTQQPAATPAAQPSPSSQYRGPLGPAIMRLLNQYPNLDLNAITPTGPKGRMLKGDVLAAIEDGSAFTSDPKPPATQETHTSTESTSSATPAITTAEKPPDADNYHDIPVTSMRRAIAKRLVQSKTTIPHRYASAKYQLDSLLDLRKRLNAMEPSPKISVNDFVIKAVAIALRRVPDMNAYWDEQHKSAMLRDQVDISMAVAIEGGLITPIVTEADRRGLADIARVTKDLAVRAKEGTLDPAEYEGGSFSTSNLGMFGISSFCAIINPPQSGNLAISSGVKRAVMDSDGALRAVTEGTVTLSTDARVIEDDTAATFLKELTTCLTFPETMIS